MRKKASIQISVNFLVVIIISIIIMGFGFVLIKKMVGNGVNTIGNLDEHLRKQIENTMLSEGKPVMIPIVQQTMKRNDVVIFGVGVLNLLNNGNENTFSIDVTGPKAFDLKTGDEGHFSADLMPEYREGIGEMSIANNDIFVFEVPIVTKNARSGYEYVFDVEVTANGEINNPYSGSKYKLYVKVP